VTPGLAVGSAWHWLAAAVVRPLRSARLRREHEALDGAAFRDLGLCRSELGSFEAEARGAAPRTRRRCAALAPTVVETQDEDTTRAPILATGSRTLMLSV
jgi:hypothetical protein